MTTTTTTVLLESVTTSTQITTTIAAATTSPVSTTTTSADYMEIGEETEASTLDYPTTDEAVSLHAANSTKMQIQGRINIAGGLSHDDLDEQSNFVITNDTNTFRLDLGVDDDQDHDRRREDEREQGQDQGIEENNLFEFDQEQLKLLNSNDIIDEQIEALLSSAAYVTKHHHQMFTCLLFLTIFFSLIFNK